ncbi:PKD domain-containing protein [Candidatus Woesearchaeota archaeon]|nr:PKD domain-containing protein [Candidatus Woesearchaeota archaeon]
MKVAPLLLAVLLTVLVVPGTSAYLLRAVAADTVTGLDINPSTLTINGQTLTGTPRAEFANIPGDTLLTLTGSATGYLTDIDNAFFDNSLPSCVGQQTCSLSKTVQGQVFNTVCGFSTQFQDFECNVSNSGITIKYFFKSSENRVTQIVRLIPTNSTPNSPPLIAASANPTSGSSPLVVNFTINVTDNVQVQTVTIFFGDGQSQTLPANSRVTHTYQTPGTFNALIQAFDNAGAQSSQTIPIIVTAAGNNSPPNITASVSPLTGNAPLTSTFQVNVTDTNGVASVVWNFGDGQSQSVAQNSVITHTYPNPGTFIATLTATDTIGAQSAQSFTVIVNNPAINAPPVIIASVTPQSGIAPLSTLFNISATDNFRVNTVNVFFGDGQSQTLLLGGNNSSFSGSTSHIYTTVGAFNATVQAVDDQGLSSLQTFTITTTAVPNTSPIINFSVNPLAGNAPLTSNFTHNVTDDGSITQVLWLFGDGKSQVFQANAQFTHTYAQAGTFLATIAAFDNLGLSTVRNVTIQVSVGNNTPPTFITASVNPQIGTAPLTSAFAVNVTDDQQVTSVLWVFGDGQQQSVAANSVINHTYSSAGTFIATVIATDNLGAQSSRSFTIIVNQSGGGNQSNQAPIINASVNPTVGNVPLTSTFIANVTDDVQVVSVTWLFGDGFAQAVSANSNITHAYLVPGTYQAQIFAFDNQGLSTTRFFTITVNNGSGGGNGSNQAPVINASVNPLAGNAPLNSTFTVNVTDDVAVSSVTWIFGDGFAQTVPANSNITHVYQNPGTFLATIIAVDNQGLTSQRNFTITVNNGSGGNQSNQAPVINASVNPLTGNAPLNSTFRANVTDDGSVSSVTWFFGDGQAQSVPANSNITHVYQTPGAFIATIVAIDNQGQSSAQSFTLTVNNASGNGSNQSQNQAPNLTASVIPQTGNAPLTSIFQVNASDDGAVASVVWLFGDGQSQTVTANSLTQHTYITPGLFVATVVATDNQGLFTVRSFNITVLAPNASNTAPSLIATVTPRRGQSPLDTTFFVNATDPNGFAVIAWFFGDGQTQLVSPFSVINHIYNTVGTFIAQLVAIDNFGLASFLNFTVDVVAPPFNNSQFLGPNVIASVNPQSGTVPLTSTFTNNVTVNNASIASVIWIFGDGQFQGVANNAQITHIYIVPGTYTAQIIATDTQNKTTSRSFTITVNAIGNSGNNQADEQAAKLFISKITMPNAYELHSGNDLEAFVSFKNSGDIRLERMHVTASIPELGIHTRAGPIRLGGKGREITTPLTLEIPKNAKAGLYTVRFSISNDDVRRTIHREVQVLEG